MRPKQEFAEFLLASPVMTFGLNSFLTECIEETLSGQRADVVVSVFGRDLDVLDQAGSAVARILPAIRGVWMSESKLPGECPRCWSG
jgi:Cu/Ag efflux pump CusA